MDLLLEAQMAHVPSGTSTHKPVSHRFVADMVKRAIQVETGLDIVKTMREVSSDGQRAVGTFVLEGKAEAPFSTTIGWVNAHDKSSSVKLLFGSHVFVCSNGCTVGEKILARKHTSKIYENIGSLTREAIRMNIGILEEETLRLERYRSISLNNEQVSHALVSAVQVGVMPAKEILPVLAEYNKSSYEAHHHNGGDAFRLLNAFTERQKIYTPQARIQRTQLLMPVLDRVVS